jgi:predicted lipoprotein
MRFLPRFPLSCALVLATACSDAQSSGPSRAAVVSDLVHEVMLPSQHALAGSTAMLPAALDLCAAPTAEAIAEAQRRWREDARAFTATEAFAYGPAMEQHLDAQLWFWPTRPETVDDIVAGTATIDAAFVDGLGTASKGLPAIEAQLFDADVLARFDTADPAGARRCAFVHELALDAAEQAAALDQAWAASSDGFGELLANPGGDNPRYPDEQSALDELVNGIIVVLQVVDDTKLGKPLGVKTGGTPLPELVEARYSDASLDTIAANLAGVRALYVGVDGLALDDLIIARAPMLDETINQQLDDAYAAIAAVPPPLDTAIVEHPFEVQLAIDAVKALRRSFSADLAQQLGITVTLSDNDGD